MATRRKVGNLLALAVLGTVLQRPMHPYEMASFLRARGKEQDMAFKWGSLYTVVRNLEKHGLIAAVESQRQGGRPERTVYRITDAGRAELTDWTRELVSTPEPEHTRFKAGLSMLGVLPPDEVISLLRQRLSLVRQDIADRRAVLAEQAKGIPRLFLVEDEYELSTRDAEATWIDALLDEITSGRFADLEAWRAFHDSGAIPPGYAELAERGRIDPT
jgi:DNA-binding PadR family transcriptional regulator